MLAAVDEARPQGSGAEPAGALSLVRREDFVPFPFEVERFELLVVLDAVRTIVRSTLELQRHASAAHDEPLVLDGRGLELIGIAVDGEPLSDGEFTRTDRHLIVPDVGDALTIEITTALSPAANKSGMGLFVLDGALATQCEPDGLCRIAYCADRPDVLARYRVTLQADRERFPVLLSNGNRVSSRDLGEGRHEAVWDDPFPKPSYVFALVAGRFARLEDHHLTPSRRTVRLAIHADERVIERCRFAMDALKRAMRWDERVYGLECDLDDYQVAALAGFPGAMENKGLNLFDLSGIVADAAITTDDEALTIERIIAHEYFHNWTGNRVTCRDWFQLSLKEGLTRFRDQTYTEDLLGSGFYRIEAVRNLQRNQFPEDDGPERHAVRPEVYATVEQFYTPTVYDKGAELIRMLRTLLGREAFHHGVAAYLERHDGQAVTTDAFVAAMEDSSGRDLGLFRRWYSQPGRPRITVERHHDAAARRFTLTLRQACADGAAGSWQPLHIPVATTLFDRDGRPLPIFRAGRASDEHSALLELKEATQSFVFENVDEPPVPSLFEAFSAPVSVQPFLALDEQLLLVAHAGDAFARWNAAQSLQIALMRRLAADFHAGRPMLVPAAVIDAFGRVLDESAGDRLVAADLLRVPDEPALSDGEAFVDLDGHAAARDLLRRAFATGLRERLLACIELPKGASTALLDVEAMGRRRLAGVALQLLMAGGDAALADRCLGDVQHAPTMTERFAALTALVDHAGPQREAALAAFYARWRDEPMVVAKWFTAQALARGKGACERILALEAHPAFDPADIPMAMAYYGSFCRQNRIAFHDPSGRGYVFLADRLLAADAMGRGGLQWLTPQIAQWRRHEPGRAALMRAELERVLGTPGISNGLRGLMTRCLGDDTAQGVA